MDLAEIEYSAQNLVQFVPEFEEYNITDISMFDPRAFVAFKEESQIDVL